MQTQEDVMDQARRCRQLAATINDERTQAVLTQMAEEFEAKAKLVWVAAYDIRDLRRFG